MRGGKYSEPRDHWSQKIFNAGRKKKGREEEGEKERKKRRKRKEKERIVSIHGFKAFRSLLKT